MLPDDTTIAHPSSISVQSRSPFNSLNNALATKSLNCMHIESSKVKESTFHPSSTACLRDEVYGMVRELISLG